MVIKPLINRQKDPFPASFSSEYYQHHEGLPQPQGMGKVDHMREIDLGALTRAKAGSGPLADPIECHDRGPIEGTGKKGAGGMGLVMFYEDVPALILSAQCVIHLLGQVQFLPEPHRQTLEELGETAWSKGQVGLQESFKAKQGFLVEGH